MEDVVSTAVRVEATRLTLSQQMREHQAINAKAGASQYRGWAVLVLGIDPVLRAEQLHTRLPHGA